MNSNSATAIETGPPPDGEARSSAWLCGLLQANDSLYPTGSYAHSFGLEGMVQEGVVRDRATLRDFVFRSARPALRHAELPLAAHAWRALAAADWMRIGEIGWLGAALKSAREARGAANAIGRQRAELVVALGGHPLAADYLRRADEGGWPFSPVLAAALEGRVHGAPLAAVLAGIYYASVASLLAAAMKLLRLGQNACQTLLAGALAQAPPDIAAAMETPFNEIGWFNPWLDIAAARHESADGRLFIS